MKIENVFGHTVVRIQCNDESVYRDESMRNMIDMVCQSAQVEMRKRFKPGDSFTGAGLTTVGQPYQLKDLPGTEKLFAWVTEALLKAKEPLGVAEEGNSVYYKRTWTNRLFKGGSGMCHRHVSMDPYMKKMTNFSEENFRPSAVAIFYADVPEGSSNLVFIRDGANDTYIQNYKEEDTYWLQPVQGELVIHSPEIWHAVSVHQSDLPRNVYVFDIDYV